MARFLTATRMRPRLRRSQCFVPAKQSILHDLAGQEQIQQKKQKVAKHTATSDYYQRFPVFLGSDGRGRQSRQNDAVGLHGRKVRPKHTQSPLTDVAVGNCGGRKESRDCNLTSRRPPFSAIYGQYRTFHRTDNSRFAPVGHAVPSIFSSSQ